jgi:hypothetical protein
MPDIFWDIVSKDYFSSDRLFICVASGMFRVMWREEDFREEMKWEAKLYLRYYSPQKTVEVYELWEGDFLPLFSDHKHDTQCKHIDHRLVRMGFIRHMYKKHNK